MRTACAVGKGHLLPIMPYQIIMFFCPRYTFSCILLFVDSKLWCSLAFLAFIKRCTQGYYIENWYIVLDRRGAPQKRPCNPSNGRTSRRIGDIHPLAPTTCVWLAANHHHRAVVLKSSDYIAPRSYPDVERCRRGYSAQGILRRAVMCSPLILRFRTRHTATPPKEKH
jgi:hypothetical protein